jgi:hypothetical protein
MEIAARRVTTKLAVNRTFNRRCLRRVRSSTLKTQSMRRRRRVFHRRMSCLYFVSHFVQLYFLSHFLFFKKLCLLRSSAQCGCKVSSPIGIFQAIAGSASATMNRCAGGKGLWWVADYSSMGGPTFSYCMVGSSSFPSILRMTAQNYWLEVHHTVF